MTVILREKNKLVFTPGQALDPTGSAASRRGTCLPAGRFTTLMSSLARKRKDISISLASLDNKQKGFTLVELLVAIFIFSIIVVGILSVFVSSSSAYQKAQAIKTVKENAEFAMSSIAKDVRMGKIDADTLHSSPSQPKTDGSLEKYLMVTRNRGGIVCYTITQTLLGIDENISPDANGKIACPSDVSKYSSMIDLSNATMNFDLGTSGFYSKPTDTTDAIKSRGWVELNLSIVPAGGLSKIDMNTDAINIETIVSSRDYGWEDVNP